jgi:hypothetical protein
VRLEGATAGGSVTVYYGNLGAATTSDGSETYDFWCDFTSADEVATVFNTVGGPSTTYADSVATITCDASEYYESKKTFSRPARLEFRMADATYGADQYPGAAGFGKYTNSNTPVVARIPMSAQKYGIVACNGGSPALGSYIARDLTLQNYQIDWISASSVTLRKNGTLLSSLSSQIPPGPLPVIIGRTYYAYSANQMRFDWVLVRAYSATPPASLDFSGEQETAAPPTTAFTANVTAGLAPLTVQFTDTSTGSPTSWHWDFGDGNTSTDQNPQHTYSSAGTYTVTLTASHTYSNDTETKTSYISVVVLQPFPGCSNDPTDPDADGLYEDINGNARWDFQDITLFFQHLVWCEANQPVSLFDWNSNGRCDFDDVFRLWSNGGMI